MILATFPDHPVPEQCRENSAGLPRNTVTERSRTNPTFSLSGSVSLARSCFRISAMVLGPFLSDLENP